jgi:hypothetical protein
VWRCWGGIEDNGSPSRIVAATGFDVGLAVAEGVVREYDGYAGVGVVAAGLSNEDWVDLVGVFPAVDCLSGELCGVGARTVEGDRPSGDSGRRKGDARPALKDKGTGLSGLAMVLWVQVQMQAWWWCNSQHVCRSKAEDLGCQQAA